MSYKSLTKFRIKIKQMIKYENKRIKPVIKYENKTNKKIKYSTKIKKNKAKYSAIQLLLKV